MRLLFAGTPEVAVPALDALLESDHEVIAVLTRPDARSGRGRTLHPSPVAVRAAEHGIETLKYAKPRDPQFLQRLRELAPDACPVVAYGGLLPKEALDIPRFGWINLHFSVLPAWRGAAPVQHSIWHGDDVTGASTFLIEEGLDTGPVFGTLTATIEAHDTAGDLLTRLADAGAGLLLATMDGIEAGRLAPLPQPNDGVTMAPKIDVDDARVDFTQPAMRVDRQIRACTPAPGAWTTFREQRLKLLSVVPDESEQAPKELAPRAISVGKRHVWIGTATQPVRLSQVQAQGKKQMNAADWARGIRLESGEQVQ